MACYWSFRLVFERGRFYLLIIFQAVELISPRVVNASLGSARCHCTCADVIQLRLRECISASVLSHLLFGQLLYYIRSLGLAIHSFLFRCALYVAKLTRKKNMPVSHLQRFPPVFQLSSYVFCLPVDLKR